VHVRGKVRQQARELSKRLRRAQLVEIVDDEDDAAVIVGELR
jgi:hypothetical protein